MCLKQFKDPCLLNFHSINAIVKFRRSWIAFEEIFALLKRYEWVLCIEHIDLIKIKEALLKVFNFNLECLHIGKGVAKMSYLFCWEDTLLRQCSHRTNIIKKTMRVTNNRKRRNRRFEFTASLTVRFFFITTLFQLLCFTFGLHNIRIECVLNMHQFNRRIEFNVWPFTFWNITFCSAAVRRFILSDSIFWWSHDDVHP